MVLLYWRYISTMGLLMVPMGLLMVPMVLFMVVTMVPMELFVVSMVVLLDIERRGTYSTSRLAMVGPGSRLGMHHLPWQWRGVTHSITVTETPVLPLLLQWYSFSHDFLLSLL